MGVPSFYRWLVGKYPKTVVNAVEEKGECVVDTSQPNPNRIEFDNLYLDMNGIIHPCFHPDDQLFPPRTFDEVFVAIFEYIDRIFRIVRPRKLLYMAIDGVAPRAKMNQQRSRRFRNAKDAEIADIEEERLRTEYEREGKEVLPKQENEVSDSNVITPGTVFMEKLAKALEYYIHLKLNSDPGWRSIKVILSDSNVPGEGEHKIMSFIRLQRNLEGYDPNTRHCLYGLDADLIMLALATHEIHFSILREDVLKQEQQEICVASLDASLSRTEFEKVKSRGWFANVLKNKERGAAKKPYQFLNIWTLREYIELDLIISDQPFKIDIERIVDDFIFVCFFTGNDFLPHLPSIEIHEGAIDLLLAVYKKVFKTLGGYLINTSKIKEKKAAYINMKRLETFILAVGSFEDRIFEKRNKLKQRKVQRLLRERIEEMNVNGFDNLQENTIHVARNARPEPDSKVGHYVVHRQSSTFRFAETASASSYEHCNHLSTQIVAADTSEQSNVFRNTKELMQDLKDLLRNRADLFKTGDFQNDKVKLGLPGFKERYYREKFFADSTREIESIRKQIVEKYTEGLCWVLQYYFTGVCSWTWYYPFSYGPFASDLRGLSCSQIVFKMGNPLKPFDQLMAVLPLRSSHALPKAYRHLMYNKDSPIVKFYPTDFVVDTDGKRFMWQGITKLPFIEEELLITETKKLDRELEDDEVKRNTLKYDKIFVSDSHVLGSSISSIDGLVHTSEGIWKKYPIDWQASSGMNGYISHCDDYLSRCCFNFPVEGQEDIREDHVISATFIYPDCHDHNLNLLENVRLPEKTITCADIMERKLWHEYEGGQPPQNINQQRYARITEIGSKSASPAPPSTRDGHKYAGSGWNRAGRGKGSSETPAISQDLRTCDGTHQRNTGRGNGSFQAGHIGEQSETFRGNQVVNKNRESNHGRLNEYSGRRHFGESSNTTSFRQSAIGSSPADRIDNWQRSPAPPVAAENGRGRGRGGRFEPSGSSRRGNAEPNRFNSYGERRAGW